MATDSSERPADVRLETRLATKRLAAPVVHRAKLNDIRLLSFSGRHDIKPLDPVGLEIKVSVEVKPRTEVQSDKKWLYIVMDFKVTAEAEGASGALRMQVEYELDYELESLDNLTSANIAGFAEWVSVYNAWPYLRCFVQSKTAEMGLPSIKIPMLKTPDQPHAPASAVDK